MIKKEYPLYNVVFSLLLLNCNTLLSRQFELHTLGGVHVCRFDKINTVHVELSLCLFLTESKARHSYAVPGGSFVNNVLVCDK